MHGEDKESTIIDANYDGDVITVTSYADGINISGFTIRNSGSGFAGIDISSNYNIVENNIIQNNNIGIKLDHSSGNQIWDNEIKNNNEDGILLHRSYANNITGNVITGNGNNGIKFTYSSLGTILDNNEISNHDENGIFLDESSLGNMFTRCTIKDNNYGVLCAGVSDGNIFHHNAFIENNLHAFDSSLDAWDYNGLGNYWDDYIGEDNDGDGIGDTPYVISGGKNEDRYPLMNAAMMYDDFDCKGYTNGNDNAEYITVYTGNPSGYNGWDIIVPDDYDSIQTAVDHANPSDRILVRSGTYHESVNISISDLTLVGEDKETTVIDGGGNGHVVFVDDMADGLNISGFTIRSKGNHFTGLYLYSDSTSVEDIICENCNIGIALRDNRDNVVKRSNFVSNNFGVWTWMCTNTVFEDNVIEDNSLDGMALQWSDHIKISRNDIAHNAFNGILQMKSSEIEVEDNSVYGNWVFGIQIFSSNDNIVKGNIVGYNSADGVSFYKSNKNVLINNIVTNNSNIGISFRFFSSDNSISGNNITNNHWCGIYLRQSSDNNNIKGNNVSNNNEGIQLWDSSNNNYITGNNISNNNLDGIELWYSSNIHITGNNISNHNSDGIELWYSSNIHITGNNITNILGRGIFSDSSNNNYITGNNISNNNRAGIFSDSSNNNYITGNNISNNNGGIQLWDSSNNRIYQNNFIENNFTESNNRLNAFFVDSYFNIWMDNYWDDWQLPFPRPILGIVYLERLDREISWLNFDWHPAREPYNIGG